MISFANRLSGVILTVTAFWGVGTPVFLRYHRVGLMLVDACLGFLFVYVLLGELLAKIWPAPHFGPIWSAGAMGLLIVFGCWFPHSAAFSWWIRHVQAQAVLLFRGFMGLCLTGLLFPQVWGLEAPNDSDGLPSFSDDPPNPDGA